MKVLFAFFTSTILFSQSHKEVPSTFSIDENRIVVWQKVYDIDLSEIKLVEALEKYFLNTEFTRGLSKEENIFTGYSNELRVKPIKGGDYYNPITAFIKVEVKDKKYRVTVKDIILKETNVGVNTSLFSLSQSVSPNFGEVVLNGRKTEFKKGFVKINYLKSHDEAFNTLFTLKKISEDKSEDW